MKKIEIKKGEREMKRFYNWMLKIKNVHLADNQRMSEAYSKIFNNA